MRFFLFIFENVTLKKGKWQIANSIDLELEYSINLFEIAVFR